MKNITLENKTKKKNFTKSGVSMTRPLILQRLPETPIKTTTTTSTNTQNLQLE